MNREMFKVYKKDVVVKIDGVDVTYNLMPLSGRYYSKLMGLFSSKKANAEGGIDFSESDFATLHELIMETIRFSYSITEKSDLEYLDRFVSQNLTVFMGVLMEVNGLNKE